MVAEFGRIAVEFLRRGSNPKIYEGAASKKRGGTAVQSSRGSVGRSLSPWRGRGSWDKGFLSSPPLPRCGIIKAEGVLSQGADPARALNTEFFFKACGFWRVMDITPSARYTMMVICIQVCGIVR